MVFSSIPSSLLATVLHWLIVPIYQFKAVCREIEHTFRFYFPIYLLALQIRDANEGADIIMVKPGLVYLDVLAGIRREVILIHLCQLFQRNYLLWVTTFWRILIGAAFFMHMCFSWYQPRYVIVWDSPSCNYGEMGRSSLLVFYSCSI